MDFVKFRKSTLKGESLGQTASDDWVILIYKALFGNVIAEKIVSFIIE